MSIKKLSNFIKITTKLSIRLMSILLIMIIISVAGCSSTISITQEAKEATAPAFDDDKFDLSQLDDINSRFKFLVSLTEMLDLYKNCTPIAIQMIKNIDDMDKYFHSISYPNYDMDTVAMYKKNVIGLSNELFETATQIKEGLIKKNKFDKEKHEKESKVLDDLSAQTYRFYQEYVTGMY